MSPCHSTGFIERLSDCSPPRATGPRAGTAVRDGGRGEQLHEETESTRCQWHSGIGCAASRGQAEGDGLDVCVVTGQDDGRTGHRPPILR